MSIWLRDNLFWCKCAGRAVFLDIEADRYFCLSTSANDAFLHLASDSTQPHDYEHLHGLITRGILVEGSVPKTNLSPTDIEPATCDYLAGAHPNIGLASIARAIASELRSEWLLRTRSFREIIELARCRKPDCGQITADQDQSIQRLIAASMAASMITRAHNRCLVRALSLHFACQKFSIRSKLVFGVMARPFAAHCWLQLGRLILVGDFEQARLYTPILVVE